MIASCRVLRAAEDFARALPLAGVRRAAVFLFLAMNVAPLKMWRDLAVLLQSGEGRLDAWLPPSAELTSLCERCPTGLGRALALAPDVHGGEAELQRHQGVCLDVKSPDHPEHVADEEEPEADVAAGLVVRGHEIRRRHGHHHRRPLQCVQQIHQGLRDSLSFSARRLVKRALPRPVPIVMTPQRSTSCMAGSSLRPCTTASLCMTTTVS